MVDAKDMKFEKHRLSSYRAFPKTAIKKSIRPGSLAKAGFYYTGKACQIQCFSCHHLCDISELGPQSDVGNNAVFDKHSTECGFNNGTDKSNVPFEKSPGDRDGRKEVTLNKWSAERNTLQPHLSILKERGIDELRVKKKGKSECPLCISHFFKKAYCKDVKEHLDVYHKANRVDIYYFNNENEKVLLCTVVPCRQECCRYCDGCNVGDPCKRKGETCSVKAKERCHWHCPLCIKTIERLPDYQKHLENHGIGSSGEDNGNTKVGATNSSMTTVKERPLKRSLFTCTDTENTSLESQGKQLVQYGAATDTDGLTLDSTNKKIKPGSSTGFGEQDGFGYQDYQSPKVESILDFGKEFDDPEIKKAYDQIEEKCPKVIEVIDSVTKEIMGKQSDYEKHPESYLPHISEATNRYSQEVCQEKKEPD